MFGEFFVQGIDGFDAAIIAERDVLVGEGVFDGGACEFEFFVGSLQAGFGEEF